MKISYFINQYPKVSHAFLRSEILAQEFMRYEIQRIALRGWDENTVVEVDIRKFNNTHCLPQYGLLKLLRAMLKKATINQHDLEFLGKQQYLSLCESGAT